MSLLFLQCSGVNGFWSVCRSEEASGLLLASSWTDQRAWLDFMAESVWCVFPVNQDGFLPSISSTSHPLPLPITRSIMLETAQDSNGATGEDTVQVSETILFCKFYF